MKIYFGLMGLIVLFVLFAFSSGMATEPFTLYIKNQPQSANIYYDAKTKEFLLPIKEAENIFKVKLGYEKKDKTLLLNNAKTTHKVTFVKKSAYVFLKDLCIVLNYEMKIYKESNSIIVSNKYRDIPIEIVTPPTPQPTPTSPEPTPTLTTSPTTPPPPKPADLLVNYNVDVSPYSPIEGENITLTVRVSNVGEGIAQDVDLRISVSGAINLTRSFTISYINPGETIVRDVYFYAYNAGQCNVHVFADTRSPEANKNNNYTTRQFLIRAKLVK